MTLPLDETQVSEIWRDPSRPADDRVADLLARMTLEEKVAQLGSVWVGASGDGDSVAPMQDQFSDEQPPLDELIRHGIGQLTRVFGSRPVDPAAGVRALSGLQSRTVAASRFGIPAVAHEECLTGFAACRPRSSRRRSRGAPRSILPWSGRWPRPSAPACMPSASTRASRRSST